MSFGYRTPETLLTRSDSKNPATTCKGLTSAGRSCRRALAASNTNSPPASPYGADEGVVTVLDEGDAAAFFCWQHKDQAEHLVAALRERTRILPLKQKSSIDTLIERVGVLDLDEEIAESTEPVQKIHRARPSRPSDRRTRKRDTLPHEWQDIGPLMSVPEEVLEEVQPRTSRPSRLQQSRPPAEQRVRTSAKSSWSCCFQAEREDLPPPRRRPYRDAESRTPRRRSQSRPDHYRQHTQVQSAPEPTSAHRKPIHYPEMRQHISAPDHSRQSSNILAASTPTRPTPQMRQSASPPHSQTASFLSLIPHNLSPTATSALLAELSKPISPADEEGYIYIFWLTPESDVSKPDDETASSILDSNDITPSPSPLRPASNNRRQSSGTRDRSTTQALQRFASVKHPSSGTRKILLKIGRASNVHRRLSQWTKQCGQNITLIRYYPYQSESLGPLSSTGRGVKVPHVHKVERLIHLELADKRVREYGKCEQCGREHKEWFEVEATKQAVKEVDATVRRWVEWAEGGRS